MDITPQHNHTPIVRSLLEDDLYKFSMWQAFLHSQPGAKAEYAFVCRNTPVYPLAELKKDVCRELDHLCELRFTSNELAYLGERRFLKSDFIDFLSVFHFQRRFIEVDTAGDRLIIRVPGNTPLVHGMNFEIFVLYIVSELYYRRLETESTLDVARERLHAKIAWLKREIDKESTPDDPFIFFDFGLRRRFSAAWHEEVVSTLARELPDNFRGTSNVYFAQKFNLTPIGTMAHEYLQAYQAFGFRLRDFQSAALNGWVNEFRGDLGIALTDVIGTDAFLADFDLFFAKLFDGVRHDSGEPKPWGDKFVNKYQSYRIDPLTKKLVFSDNLDFTKAFDLYRYFKGRIQRSFGIGTWLSNDTPIQPLNLVMKIMSCNGQPVAKLSDSPGKTLCQDETFLSYLRQVFTPATGA